MYVLHVVMGTESQWGTRGARGHERAWGAGSHRESMVRVTPTGMRLSLWDIYRLSRGHGYKD